MYFEIEITRHPQDRLVAHGSSVVFICASSVTSNVTFSWTHNGTFENHNSSTLIIISASHSDAGSYMCTVSGESVSVMSNTAILTVYGIICMFILKVV